MELTESTPARTAHPEAGPDTPEPERPGQDLVSVIVPARDEEASIDAALRALRLQDHRNLQIIVVDGGSTDRTVAVVRQHMAEDPRIELLHNPRHTIPVSLNLALGETRGRWLVRLDAHSTVDPGYVGTAVSRLREARWGGVGGRKDGTGTTRAGRAIAAALGSRFGVGGSVYHYGTREQEVDHIPFGAYPTQLVRRLGGWDERLVANEDFEFDHRLRRTGAALLFDPRLTIAWQSKQSLGDLYRQYLRYGKGKVDVARLHPESLRWRHVLPPLLVPYLGAAVVLAPRRPATACSMLVPYAAAVAIASTRAARRLEDRGARMLVPGAFLAMHVGWGVGVWARVLDIICRRSARPFGAHARTRSAGGIDVVGYGLRRTDGDRVRTERRR